MQIKYVIQFRGTQALIDKKQRCPFQVLSIISKKYQFSKLSFFFFYLTPQVVLSEVSNMQRMSLAGSTAPVYSSSIVTSQSGWKSDNNQTNMNSFWGKIRKKYQPCKNVAIRLKCPNPSPKPMYSSDIFTLQCVAMIQVFKRSNLQFRQTYRAMS